MIRRYPLLSLLVVVGVLAALVISTYRVRVERSARTVEVILDADAWRELALREGQDPGSFLKALQERGAGSVAAYEATLHRLRDAGRLAYVSGEEMLAAARSGSVSPPLRALLDTGTVRAGELYLFGDRAVLAWVADGFRGILGAGRVHARGDVLEVDGIRDDLEEIGLGIVPSEASGYRSAGFRVVLRVRNYRGLTAEAVAAKVRRLRTAGEGTVVVFELSDVLGYERLVGEAAAALRGSGFRFGRIEVFTARRRQRGEEALTRAMQPEVLRLFSVTPEELAALTPPQVIDKFVRSAVERNIRLLYIRPLMNTAAGIDPLQVNLDLVGAIGQRLQARGFQIGRATPLPPVRYPLPVLGLVVLGGLSLGAILIAEVARASGMRVGQVHLLGLVLAGLAITAVAWAGGQLLLWRKALALGVAIAGATLATLGPLRSTESGGSPLGRALSSLWQATAVSAGAGIIVAALLTGWSFMLAFDSFTGVKLAHVAPPVLVAFLLAFGTRAHPDPGATFRSLWRWLERPLRLQYAVVAVLAAVVAVMVLGRSGNFGLPLFAVEERMRSLLENLLVARPRTKEFLIGHPAMMLAGAAAAMGLRPWVLPLALVGAIGQAGIINSFSHIHTPLALVVWRSANALVIGSVLGAVAVTVVAAGVRRWRPTPESLRAGLPSPTSPPAP